MEMSQSLHRLRRFAGHPADAIRALEADVQRERETVARLRKLLENIGEHDTDEDGIHRPGNYYRGMKGGMEGRCDGCIWDREVSEALRNSE